MFETRRLAATLATLALVMVPNATRRATAVDAVPNDNRVAAGTRIGDTLAVALDVSDATWRPYESDALAIPVHAFAEHGKAPSVPGPIVRVTAGTVVRVTLANRLDRRTVVRGLQDRSAPPDSIVLAAGESRTVTFRATTPGTYLYAGHSNGDTHDITRGKDSQLVGSLIVDPLGTTPDPHERVIVITVWDDSVPDARWEAGHAQAFAINGLSWPHTERLTYIEGDTVRWRVLNASTHFHPMHLHGFFFTTRSQGTFARDTIYEPGDGRAEVTHAMRAATTIALEWVAERPGNWLYHCHMIPHFETDLRPELVGGHGAMAHDRIGDVMSGLVSAITVRPRADSRLTAAARAQAAARVTRRALRVLVVEQRGAMRFALPSRAPSADTARPVGPTLVLTQGEPTRITVVNRAPHATAVHWHGLEIESWYDGVAGWSGADARTAPLIAPGDSFVVHVTPRRAGTYMYHTHADERAQLPGGMYGAIVVLPRGRATRGTDDHLAVLTEHGIELPDDPRGALALDPTRPTRVRLIGIPFVEPLRIRLERDSVALPWTIVGKDGAPLPASQVKPVGEITLGAGETYDLLVPPDTPPGASLVLRYPSDPEHQPERVRVVRRQDTSR